MQIYCTYYLKHRHVFVSKEPLSTVGSRKNKFGQVVTQLVCLCMCTQQKQQTLKRPQKIIEIQHKTKKLR